jgi:Fe-S-cluster containining protein
MTTDSSNPCFECGQCCQKLRVSFYHGEIAADASGIANHSSAGIVPPELTVKLTPHLACMKGTEGGQQGCVALSHDAEQGYRCTIYEQRPSPCRAFNIFEDDGSLNPLCDKLRKAAGLKSISAQ